MRWRGVCLAAAVLLLVGACSKNTSSSHTAQSADQSEPASSFKTAEELIREADERSRAASEEKAHEVYGDVAGTYVCAYEEMDRQFWPSLELLEDGSAVFHANLLTSMGDLKGAYTQEGETVKMVISKSSFDGFSGDKVTDLVFDFVSEEKLELAYTVPNTSVGMTSPGDQFEKED